jgi:DNA polymerase-3 subunit delta'
MRFSDIIGFDALKRQLIQSVVSDQIAHAQLFLGPEGGPNLALALAFSSYINCQNRTDHDSCGECNACKKNSKLVHPDLHFAFPVSSTKNIPAKDAISVKFLSEWRNFVIQDPYNNASGWNNYFGGENKQLNISRQESREIIRNLSLKPFEGLYKIMIIWLPEYMHPAAANALLKIFEEPPPSTLFILVSNDETKLLSTILSRTQIVQIRPFSDEEIKELLINQHFIEEDKASQIAHLVDGNINEALRLAREVEDDSHRMFREWMRLCYVGDLIKLTNWTDKFHSMSKVAQQTLFQYGLSMMREALIAKNNEMNLSRLMGEELEFIKKFSQILTFEYIELISKILTEAFHHIERNANSKILFLSVSLKIFEIFQKIKMWATD